MSPKIFKGTINDCYQRNNRVTLQKRPQKYLRGRFPGVANLFLATIKKRCLRNF